MTRRGPRLPVKKPPEPVKLRGDDLILLRELISETHHGSSVSFRSVPQEEHDERWEQRREEWFAAVHAHEVAKKRRRR